MKILMLCDWLPPDFGAIGQYAAQHARELADQGHEVCLVGFTSGDAREDVMNYGRTALTERRVRMPTYDRDSLPLRALWTLRANLMLLWAARRELVRAAA